MRFRKSSRVVLRTVIFIVFLLSSSYFVVQVHASEPSLIEIFNYLGFTNVAETTVETFPAGTYNITLHAEFAGYADENELSHYEVNTSVFAVIFTGPEGGSEYISPPITKTFATDYQFGLSLLSHGYRYFTETSRNPDGEQHAKVYRNLDNPNVFLIGFDERTYCDGSGDGDYNDLVFSLQLQYYLTVVSPYDTLGGDGWYYNGSNASASLADGVIDHGNGTRRVFTHWSGDASGTNYSKSEPIYMNQNKTAIANWKTQYYLTVQTDPTDLSPTPTPSSNWYDENTNVTLTAPNKSYLGSDEYLFDYWDVDRTSQGAGANPVSVHMDQPHTATAHYVQIPPLSASISPTTAKIKIGESVTFTSTVSGGVPDYSYQWYLNGSAVSGAVYPEWTFEPTSTGFYIVYLNVTDNLGSTVKSNEALVTVAPKLTVSISPTEASILVGQSVEFTSTVSGGYSPYSYQWYLNGNPGSGATSSSWTFTPTSSGIYYVHLKVTDANNNVAPSDTARITVGAVPVGGYSVSLTKPLAKTPLICYTMLLAIFGTAISLIKRKRK